MAKPLALQIRESVAAAEYSRATELWSSYVDEISAEARGGIDLRLTEMRELVEWTRATVQRARLQQLRPDCARLMTLDAARVYRRTCS